MAGRVVRAREGRRDEYRPLATPLAAGSDPEAVLAGLMAVHPFETCYVADLDAILGRGDHRQALAGLTRRWPGVEFWVDAGLADAEVVAAWPRALGRPVLGSESLASPGVVLTAPDAVLSLDFRDGSFLGPADLATDPACWPDDIIVMDLNRVGSGRGPDTGRLAALRAKAPEKRFHGAGGTRNPADLEAWREAGAAGVLLASALHDGGLTAPDLAARAQRTR